MHPNTKSKNLKISMVSSQSNPAYVDKKLPPENYHFEPGEIYSDDDGLVLFFTYINIHNKRLEFVAQEKVNTTTVSTVVKSVLSFAADVIFYYKAMGKADELNRKFQTKELTGKQVVADASMWLLLREVRGVLIHKGVDYAGKELRKMFPNLGAKRNVVYYETQTGMLRVEGALYV